MSFENIPDRTTDDSNAAADVTQLMENIRVLSGNGTLPPPADIKSLNETFDVFSKKNIDNLVIKPNVTNYNSQIDIAFSGLKVGRKYLSNVAETIDITTALDTGIEAISTWYYIWCFVKADGSYVFKFSVSSTAPTIPEGYIYQKLISVVRNDASGNFVTFHQSDDKYLIAATAVLSAGNASARTAVDISASVPHLVTKTIFGSAYSGVAAKTLYISPLNSAIGEIQVVSTATIKCYFRISLLSANIYYYSTATGSATLQITGFELSL